MFLFDSDSNFCMRHSETYMNNSIRLKKRKFHYNTNNKYLKNNYRNQQIMLSYCKNVFHLNSFHFRYKLTPSQKFSMKKLQFQYAENVCQSDSFFLIKKYLLHIGKKSRNWS